MQYYKKLLFSLNYTLCNPTLFLKVIVFSANSVRVSGVLTGAAALMIQKRKFYSCNGRDSRNVFYGSCIINISIKS